MPFADPNLKPKQPARRRPRFASIQAKLERLIHSNDHALRGYRSEMVSILDALDALNRDARGIRTRGRPGDVELD